MTLPLSDIFAVLPELIVVTAACLVLALDPLTPSARKSWLAWLSLAALVACFWISASQMGVTVLAFSGLVILDPYAGFWKLLLYVVTGLTILLSLAYLKEERINLGEYYGFILLSLSGMMIMVSAADLLTIYLGIELMSMSLYVLAGFKRFEERSLEASAKYFVLGSFSSGILLYGISLLFGVAGSTRLQPIAAAVELEQRAIRPVRVLGEVTEDRLALLREADAIVQDEVRRARLERELWQAFAVLLPVRTVGVMGDFRTYAQVIALRAVTSQDAMTADWARLPYDLLGKISSRIINEVKGVNRVVFDISSKPPSTIEWE